MSNDPIMRRSNLLRKIAGIAGITSDDGSRNVRPSRLDEARPTGAGAPASEDAFMNQHVNRRSLVAAAATVASIGPAFAQGRTGPSDLVLIDDDALFAAERHNRSCSEAADTANDRAAERRMAVRKNLPPKPVEQEMSPELHKAFRAIPLSEVNNPLNPVVKEIDAQARRHKAAVRAHANLTKRAMAAAGVPQLEAEEDRLRKESLRAYRAFMETPCRTIDGVLLKLRDLNFEGNEDHSRVIADLERIASSVPPIMAAAGVASTPSARAHATSHPDEELLRLEVELDHLWAEENRVCVESQGLSGHDADRVNNAAMVATSAIVDAIEAKTALTLDGLRVQAKAVSWCHQGETPIDLAGQGTTDERLASKVINTLLTI